MSQKILNLWSTESFPFISNLKDASKWTQFIVFYLYVKNCSGQIFQWKIWNGMENFNEPKQNFLKRSRTYGVSFISFFKKIHPIRWTMTELQNRIMRCFPEIRYEVLSQTITGLPWLQANFPPCSYFTPLSFSVGINSLRREGEDWFLIKFILL